jgi:endonuclease
MRDGSSARVAGPGRAYALQLAPVRLVIARCSVDYAGRLSAHLPLATRLLIVKADTSVLVHSDGGSYKPLNWMSPPCRLAETESEWIVTGKSGETLTVHIEELISDTSYPLGEDPGLVKDGVEAHLQELLAAQVNLLDKDWRLVRREFPTAIGPVDLMCRDTQGVTVEVEAVPSGDGLEGAAASATSAVRPRHWAVEIKRRATIDAVEQLTRYLELLNRDPLLAPVGGVLAAQSLAPQARTLAEDRGIRCVVLDYEAMRGTPSNELTLF